MSGEPLTETACISSGHSDNQLHIYLKQEVLVRDVELTRYHQLEEFRKGQKESGNTSLHMLPASQNPPRWNPSWLSDACAARKDPDGPARSNSETKPITIKPETANHMVECFSWVPLRSCSPPSCPSQWSLLLCPQASLPRQFISEC